MFISTYENKLDKKGRVSVPATFRSPDRHHSTHKYSQVRRPNLQLKLRSAIKYPAQESETCCMRAMI